MCRYEVILLALFHFAIYVTEKNLAIIPLEKAYKKAFMNNYSCFPSV